MPLGVGTLALVMTATFIAALAASAWLRAFAVRRALVDVPNDRSLHVAPVPRLGGMAIVVASAAAIAATLVLSGNRAVAYWLAGALAIAILGGVDDVSSLPAAPRFAIQIAVSAAFVGAIGLPHSVALTSTFAPELPTAVTMTAAVFWLVATLNIYNFLDGMDGLAGAQGAGGGLAIATAFGITGRYDLAAIAALMAAATAGFLVHNAPPARIFMGDAGSTYLGWGYAALALLGLTQQPSGAPFVVVPVALAPFLIDGTFTLLRRALRREPFWRAHRSHLYQRAVQTGLDHREVLIAYVAWIAISAAACVLVARARPSRLLVAAGVELGAFAAVLTWVRARERKGALGNRG